MANGPINGKLKKAEAQDLAFRTTLHSILWKYKNGLLEDAEIVRFGTDRQLSKAFEEILELRKDVFERGLYQV